MKTPFLTSRILRPEDIAAIERMARAIPKLPLQPVSQERAAKITELRRSIPSIMEKSMDTTNQDQEPIQKPTPAEQAQNLASALTVYDSFFDRLFGVLQSSEAKGEE